jgi:hypothetical protein
MTAPLIKGLEYIIPSGYALTILFSLSTTFTYLFIIYVIDVSDLCAKSWLDIT